MIMPFVSHRQSQIHIMCQDIL